MDELKENVLTLEWLIEDYGHMVDTAIEIIIETIEKLRNMDYDLGLTLSRVYENEPWWDGCKQAALENLNEVQAELSKS
jgi:hypothetical protein